ncbi:hypothetical protein FQR65_LT17773 [Abscondita terminalis]|nr:hypothetical protein FQR65_LT17773 [Abscondita terminalis]
MLNRYIFTGRTEGEKQTVMLNFYLRLPNISNLLQLNAQLGGQTDVLLKTLPVIAGKEFLCQTGDQRELRFLDIKGGPSSGDREESADRTGIYHKRYLSGYDAQQINYYLQDKYGPGQSCFAKGSNGLIVLMAQIGRASDNLSSGESTFMVEMNETASIMNNLSDRSLILLDEIGRGTSTYDGISIAWAIAEFLHNHPTARAKTLFATHYHELNELSTSMPRIKNFNVTVKEVNNKVIFCVNWFPEVQKQLGIHVAKLAGNAPKLLGRANEILKRLERGKRYRRRADKGQYA